MTKYFKIVETNDWLVDPIESNHKNLIEVTKEEFDAGLELKNNPPKTYSQELAELNSDKEEKEDALAKKMSKVQMRNGPAEAPTIEAMRAAILTEIDSAYAAKKAALRAKYFGE